MERCRRNGIKWKGRGKRMNEINVRNGKGGKEDE